MIAWSGVSVSYNGGEPALGRVDLSVAAGEWVAVIGPNGAGKSTLLKAAVGAVPYQGVIEIDGHRPRLGLDVAWMPQRPGLPEDMGVGDYVLLGRTPHLGYLAAESEHDVEMMRSAIESLDLAGFARRRLGTLSGGEAQRAVLARALAQEAPVLLLDEPTTGLDVGHAVEVLDVVDGLRRSQGLTVVTAAHDLTLAGRYADRLVLLAAGEVVAEGEPRAVLDEATLQQHYGSGLRVLDDPDGPIVVPVRSRNV